MKTIFLLSLYDRETENSMVDIRLDNVIDADLRSLLHLSPEDDVHIGSYDVPDESLPLLSDQFGPMPIDPTNIIYQIGEWQDNAIGEPVWTSAD